MSDNNIRRPTLIAAQRQQVPCHVVKAASLLRAHLRKTLTWKINRNDVVVSGQ